MVHPLAARALRASPRFTLTLVDRLGDRERERLAPLMRDPDFFGVLRDDRGTTELGATRDVALLFLTLRATPGPLPAYAARAGDSAWPVVTQLVLDGVLEIETPDGFVSGPAAVAEFGAAASAAGRIAALSRRALTDATVLGLGSLADIDAHLYRYNRAPVTPEWSARVGQKAGVRSFLAIDAGPLAARLNAGWISSTGATEDGWIRWAHRDGATPRDAAGATYKVYVSPVLADLPQAMRAVLPILETARVPAFKLGSTAHALARADKMVCYFASPDDATECGQLLATALSGISPQGVPFTAELGGDGLVSWGMDQPDPREHGAQLSWRRWVCRRLAKYLLVAREESAPAAADFALARLQLEGVDVGRWSPGQGLIA